MSKAEKIRCADKTTYLLIERVKKTLPRQSYGVVLALVLRKSAQQKYRLMAQIIFVALLKK
jgi:hypothetical protein